MLGRVPTGAAFAALPLAAVLTAASQEWWWLVGLAGAILALTLLWMFAPSIPHVRELLPAQRRLRRLEQFWLTGHVYLNEAVVADGAQFVGWKRGVALWETQTREWIAKHISPVEAKRFTYPKVVSHSLTGSYSPEHSALQNAISYQLPKLIRLRDEEERKLH